MRATMVDGRQLVGQMLAFDKVGVHHDDIICARMFSANMFSPTAHEPRPRRL
jgi:hypothetical protein